MDKYKVKAQGIDKKGNKNEFSIVVLERDSEVISKAEKELMLYFAASKKSIEICSAIEVELID